MPVWGAILSDPLPIVGMVGRCPAIYLMGRMAIRHRLAAFHPRGCPLGSYGVLISLSGGCPPVPARFHTRCAPVRRSPASHCCDPLPLDLHVLGLSLAFILSQDQTLRCMTLLCFILSGPPRRRGRPPLSFTLFTLSVRHFQYFNVLMLPWLRPLRGGLVAGMRSYGVFP